MHIEVGIDKDAMFYRCFLDGKEISNQCYAADEEKGWADTFVRFPDGRFHEEFRADGTKGFVTARLFGRVELKRMEPL